jgi:hypothetical protein
MPVIVLSTILFEELAACFLQPIVFVMASAMKLPKAFENLK